MNTTPKNTASPISVKNNELSEIKISNILIVEDEPDALAIFKNVLEVESNYKIYQAEDGLKALTILKENKIDLVLLDIIMPQMDGLETLKNIKSKPEVYGKPIVIMLTNVGGESVVHETEVFKADGYILKIEIDPEELLGKVKEYITQIAAH